MKLKEQGFVTLYSFHPEQKLSSPFSGEALLQYRFLLRPTPVNADHFENLQAWMCTDDGGHAFVNNAEDAVYSEESRDDLTSPSVKDRSTDTMTALIHSFILPWYHKPFGRRYMYRTRVLDPSTGLRPQVPTFH